MKKLSLSALALLLSAGLAACSEEASEPAGKKEAAQTEEAATETTTTEEAPAEDSEFETQVGETIENEAGSFKLLKRNSDVEPITTGPFTITIPQVNAISGTVKPDYVDMMGGKEQLEYIQIDMEIAHNEEGNNSLLSNISQITTSTGEQIEADMLMSEQVDSDFIGKVNKKGSYYYILQDSKAADVEWVRLIMEAPNTTETMEPVGEKIDIEIPFK